METEFTPWASLAGGLLIGTASVLLMATLGRIYGATGIVAGVFFPETLRDWAWRAALLAGMAAAPGLFWALSGQMPAVQVPVGSGLMVLGGLLVGIGVTFGGGCTSGHGVCGMARLSIRSIVATATFMLFTGLTVYALRHLTA
ncbi:YeeE/YedE family protein [Rhodobacter sp. Har01]|nr:YeeE/YedE family protein [Rhodobacter sp. Har01]MCB6179388.1 YeeE/YedE family protein [Rhodobacter sp. Har01]